MRLRRIAGRRRSLKIFLTSMAVLVAGVMGASPAHAASEIASVQTVWDGSATSTYESLTNFYLEGVNGICDDAISAYPVTVSVNACRATMSVDMLGSADACTGAGLGTIVVRHSGRIPTTIYTAFFSMVGGQGTYQIVSATTSGNTIAAAGGGTVNIVCLYYGDVERVASGYWDGHADEAAVLI